MEESQELAKRIINIYEESEKNIETNAILSRVYVDKLSNETIEEKVSAQMNSISASIHGINPKFAEGSKNYIEIKEKVTNIIAKYEQALYEVSIFFDTKIEQLIIRRVELETSLISSLVNHEYYIAKSDKRKKQKDNDYLKNNIKEGLEEAFEKIKLQKEENKQIDPMILRKLADREDIIQEIDEKNVRRVEEIENMKKSNKSDIESIESELQLINSEINRLNIQKKQAIYDAMEVGDKAITKNIRKPKVFSTLTRFFASKFNTSKVIENQILNPLNNRIDSFINNDLVQMKG